MDDEPTLHFGLDVAQLITVTERSNIDLLMEWARNGIANFRIQLDTRNYEVLLTGPEMFDVTDGVERQQYFRFIFSECLKNGRR